MGGIFQNSWRGAAAKADAIGEQRTTWGAELKRTQLGSSSRSGRNREAVGNREQHAAEADASGEQQLCIESYPAPDYLRRRKRGK